MVLSGAKHVSFVNNTSLAFAGLQVSRRFLEAGGGVWALNKSRSSGKPEQKIHGFRNRLVLLSNGEREDK